ncbi:2-(3-amino-3-carboxypropyl)histidine synthase subunit 1-like [Zingiber officinale]|uniref:2-(3-amino-3-carboxypropyl)histidine synthase subunit 1-like n=1 Tax=Zingiber officinale TaxID=94328 RepID=UPI001C4C7117|nr:2-(3-amino-3-carboxypropyl)histidine synthase subunit 1-like [Zingiber officinale]
METDKVPSSTTNAAPLVLSSLPNQNPNLTAGGSDDSSSAPKRISATAPKRFVKSHIPESILSDPSINAAAALLPSNYDFEVHKTVHRIASSGTRRPALQLPDGLLMYALPIADILQSAADTRLDEVLILADPTYGACCLDDFAASALSADLLVHYGHSCLVPVPTSRLPVLYVFVDIRVDTDRLVQAVRSAFPSSSKLALAGTIQFVAAVHSARSLLSADGYDITVPQAKPLSPGEVLGCTAPTIPRSKGIDAVVFVADGRFHLEAFMIANPEIPAFRYDPFLGVLVLEKYDHEGMKRARKDAILAAREAKRWGIILGTLGRQGNTRVLDRVLDHMEEKGLESTTVLMSEISPARIALFGDSIDAWVQIACPRLSIDWGEGFTKPLLTTFELDIALGYVPGWWEKEQVRVSVNAEPNTCKEESCSCSRNCEPKLSDCNCKSDAHTGYPMDYYAQDGGDWNSSYVKKKPPSSGIRLQRRIGRQSGVKT